MKLRTCLLVLLLLPIPALAAGFSYDYLDAGHERSRLQNGQDGSGSFVDFSYGFLDGIQFRGRYDSLRYAAPAGYTAKNYSVGITGDSSVTDSTDVYTDLLYLNNHYNSWRPIATTDNGYRLAIGLRHRVWDRLEADGYVAHNYLTLASNEAGVSLLFNATSWLAIGAFYSHDSNYNNSSSLRLRWYF